MIVWHWLVVILGNRDEAGGWYGFWSGFAGAVQPTLLGGAAVWYYHHTCHAKPTCLRWGKHEAAGGMFRLCHKHHPDLGERPRASAIGRLHRDWQASR